MLLDRIAPPDARGRVDQTFVPAPPGGVFAALQQIAPAELPRIGFAFRGLPWLLPFEAEKPLYAQMLDAGFAVMGVTPLREVVLGRVARPLAVLNPEPRVKNKRELAAFEEAGHVKVALGFALRREEQRGQSGTLVSATMKLWPAKSGGAPGLAWIWPGMSLAGGIFARDWLRALSHRAD